MKHRFKLKGLWLAPFLLISLLETGLTVFAQNDTLTLDKTIEMALKTDYTVKTDTNTLLKTKLAVKKAALDIFPTATVEGEYQYQTADQTYPNSYEIIIQETIPTKFNLYGKKIETDIEAAMWDQISAEAALQVELGLHLQDREDRSLQRAHDDQAADAAGAGRADRTKHHLSEAHP